MGKMNGIKNTARHVPPPSPIIRDLTDMVFYAAIAMLPIDGTRIGISLPYWTPISPWLFALYAVLNWRYLRDVFRRYLPFFLFPFVLIAVSTYGWSTIGIHPVQALTSFVSIVLGLCCLASLEIVVWKKRLSVRRMMTVLVATYWFAFVIGVIQFIALLVNPAWKNVQIYFGELLLRPYVWDRPQFLFAEPSYIGMHLFGVLLPTYWLTKDRRIGILVPVFAIGSSIMGAGTRIVLDSLVALFVWLLVAVNFKSIRATMAFLSGLITLGASGIVSLMVNPRLNSLVTHGLLSGDESMSSRIFHMLAPAWSWKHDLSHVLLGWGAGNISNAVRTGYVGARRWFDLHGGKSNSEIDKLSNPPVNTFTMSAYVSFITEFGVLCFLCLLLAIVVYTTIHHAWNRMTVCWLLLMAYLFVQFEAYSFYAVPLFLCWAGSGSQRNAVSDRI